MSEREARPKKTVIGSFLGRLGRSKSRGADADRKKEKNGVLKEPVVSKNVPVSKSDGNIKTASDRKNSVTSHRVVPEAAANFLVEEARMSPARRLFNRFSTFRSTGRFRSTSSRASNDSLNENGLEAKTASEHDLLAPKTPKTTRGLAPPSGVPTGAQSETDLRFVTTRDSHRSVPANAPFGFGESPRAFMSENDLASSSDADFPEVNRTPSYLRISCALNGYTKSPKKLDLTPKGGVPVLGESLVERRTRMFSMPQERKPAPEFNSPVVTTQSCESKTSEIECSTPAAPPLQHSRLHALQMGNNVSTPGPIRDLISKFDQLDLCSAHHKNNEKEGVENIEPHKFVINQQPDFDEIDLKTKDPNGNEEEKDLRVSTDAESDSGISGSSPASSKKNVEILKDKEDEVTTSTPTDGHDFRKLHDRVKADLLAKMEAATKDLEKADDLPEKCADSLRAANGNAQLLVRKKFPKFSELIETNLNPVADDPKPVTTEDLEGFWNTIDIELKGIIKEFAKVEAFRAANWDPNAVQEDPEPDTTAVIAPKPRPATAKKPKMPELSEEAKKKLQDQKALAEQRRAEMRAQMRQQRMKAMAEKEQNRPELNASEDC